MAAAVGLANLFRFIYTYMTIRSTHTVWFQLTANTQSDKLYNHIKANRRIQNIYTKLFMDFSTVAFSTRATNRTGAQLYARDTVEETVEFLISQHCHGVRVCDFRLLYRRVRRPHVV